jgi:hypothetical protein
MYHAPSKDEPVLFGDVFSSSWLFDAFINKDAVPLREITLKGGTRGYAPVTTSGQPDRDFLLAHGTSCRAIVLSDDCEIESCLVRRGGRGRLVFAALERWPTGSTAADVRTSSFRRHPLEPGDGFEGGIAEFFRLFAVTGHALLAASGRIICLEDDARALLEQRWAAFATRRGPLAAADNTTKLAHVLDAAGDPDRFKLLVDGDALPKTAAQDIAKTVARALIQAWRAEGEIMQKIADIHEQRLAGLDEIALLETEMRTLGDYATAAANSLRDRAIGSSD